MGSAVETGVDIRRLWEESSDTSWRESPGRGASRYLLTRVPNMIRVERFEPPAEGGFGAA
jgi:hypothetical protein